MSISQLAQSINPSPTLRLNEEARILKAQGEPVINLGIGEPKNKAPFSAVLSATAKLQEGEIKYAPTGGLPSLKKAIIQYTEENYGRLAAPENVIVSTGAKQSIYNALLSVVDPQDEVILLAPYWVSYPEMVMMVGGKPIVVTPDEGTLYPRMKDIEKAAGSRTKAIIVNSPNNPSGVVYPEELVAAIVDFCERKGITLIADDIYHKLVFDGVHAPPAYRYTQKDIESTSIVVINGVSKTYGMTGFRIGWAIASRELVGAMGKFQAQTTSCADMVAQAAAEGALAGDQSVIENLRLSIQNNRDVVINELSTFTDMRTVKPGGTFYCLPDFRAYSQDSVELAGFLLEKALVVTVPGKDFGMEGYLRLSYAGPMKEVTSGIERIKWALDPNAPSEINIGSRRLVRDWS